MMLFPPRSPNNTGARPWPYRTMSAAAFLLIRLIARLRQPRSLVLIQKNVCRDFLILPLLTATKEE
jgi:hypothetical protein